MIIVDTSVWIDYFNGVENWQADRLDWLLSHEVVGIGDIILAEVLIGLQKEKDHRMVQDYLSELECVTMGGREIALKAAELQRTLRRSGVTVCKTADLMIAAWCMEHGAELLQREPEFDEIAAVVPLNLVRI